MQLMTDIDSVTHFDQFRHVLFKWFEDSQYKQKYWNHSCIWSKRDFVVLSCHEDALTAVCCETLTVEDTFAAERALLFMR